MRKPRGHTHKRAKGAHHAAHGHKQHHASKVSAAHKPAGRKRHA